MSDLRSSAALNDATATMPLAVRLRRSPFWPRVHLHGPQMYLSYNSTLMASGFRGSEEDYRHLKSAVQLWDVGCERQIELRGPDAARLLQLSTPRDVSAIAEDQCFYIPTVDRDGGMTNDPVLLKIDEDRYWVSIADSDLLLFYKGAAAALNLDVRVFDAEVWPLAIQGPRADDLAARIWGDAVRDIRFFRYRRVEVGGRSMILARSGYSVQGGFELYFEGEEGATALWDQLMEAGGDLDVRAGSPCRAERVEAGLLSYRTDITADMTPMEAGLGRFCQLDRDLGCAGWAALRARREPERQIRPVEIAGPPLPVQTTFWPVTAGDTTVGRVSSVVWAWSYDCNAAIALVDRSHWAPGTELVVQTSDGPRDAVVREGFWGGR